MAKTLLPVQGAWVPSLVRELDSICCSKSRVLAATKIQWNQINIKKINKKCLRGVILVPHTDTGTPESQLFGDRRVHMHSVSSIRAAGRLTGQTSPLSHFYPPAETSLP